MALPATAVLNVREIGGLGGLSIGLSVGAKWHRPTLPPTTSGGSVLAIVCTFFFVLIVFFSFALDMDNPEVNESLKSEL